MTGSANGPASSPGTEPAGVDPPSPTPAPRDRIREPRFPWRLALTRPVDAVVALVEEDPRRYRFLAPFAVVALTGTLGSLLAGEGLMAVPLSAWQGLAAAGLVWWLAVSVAFCSFLVSGEASFARTWSAFAWSFVFTKVIQTAIVFALALGALIVLVIATLASGSQPSAWAIATGENIDPLVAAAGWLVLVVLGPLVAAGALGRLRRTGTWEAAALLGFSTVLPGSIIAVMFGSGPWRIAGTALVVLHAALIGLRVVSLALGLGHARSRA